MAANVAIAKDGLERATGDTKDEFTKELWKCVRIFVVFFRRIDVAVVATKARETSLSDDVESLFVEQTGPFRNMSVPHLSSFYNVSGFTIERVAIC